MIDVYDINFLSMSSREFVLFPRELVSLQNQSGIKKGIRNILSASLQQVLWNSKKNLQNPGYYTLAYTEVIVDESLK